ncbi:hypothetical protein L7Q46_001741 [Serratia marcescens]|nr:hypothetical protein [Serratia marcescens]
MDKPVDLFKYRDFEKKILISITSKEFWIPNPHQINFGLKKSVKIKTAMARLLKHHNKPTQLFQIIKSDSSTILSRAPMDENPLLLVK